MAEGAGAAALHLLEVVAAFHVAHEQQALQRLHVGAGGDHVHGDSDAGEVVVAELGEDGLGILVGLVGDLFAEGVPLAELLADDLDDVVGVAVGLGEDEGLGDLGAAGENLGEFLAEGSDDGADLVRHDDAIVELFGGVGLVLVLLLPATAAGEFLAFLDLLFGNQAGAGLGDLGLDGVDLVAHVDPVGDGFLVAVVADDVLAKEAVGAVVGRGGEAEEEGVEVVEHLLPEVIDGTVALIDDDEVEEFGRHTVAVDDGERLFRLGELFGRAALLGGLVERLVLEDRVEALDGADADLTVGGDVGGFQALDGVELGKLPVIVRGSVGHELLLGLLAEIFRVDEEEDALGLGVFEETVDGGDGREGLARARGHLDEGPRAGLTEGGLEIGDSDLLAITQAEGLRRKFLWVKQRQRGETGAKGGAGLQPGAKRLGAVKAEDLARAGFGIAGVGEPGDGACAFVEEGERLGVVDPF